MRLILGSLVLFFLAEDRYPPHFPRREEWSVSRLDRKAKETAFFLVYGLPDEDMVFFLDRLVYHYGIHQQREKDHAWPP